MIAACQRKDRNGRAQTTFAPLRIAGGDRRLRQQRCACVCVVAGGVRAQRRRWRVTLMPDSELIYAHAPRALVAHVVPARAARQAAERQRDEGEHREHEGTRHIAARNRRRAPSCARWRATRTERRKVLSIAAAFALHDAGTCKRLSAPQVNVQRTPRSSAWRKGKRRVAMTTEPWATFGLGWLARERCLQISTRVDAFAKQAPDEQADDHERLPADAEEPTHHRRGYVAEPLVTQKLPGRVHRVLGHLADAKEERHHEREANDPEPLVREPDRDALTQRRRLAEGREQRFCFLPRSLLAHHRRAVVLDDRRSFAERAGDVRAIRRGGQWSATCGTVEDANFDGRGALASDALLASRAQDG